MRMTRGVLQGLAGIVLMLCCSTLLWGGARLTGFGVVRTPPPAPNPARLPMQTALVPPTGSEFCGIVGSTDFIFQDGFEGTTPQPNYLYSTRSVVGSAPTVTLTYPANGATLTTRTTPAYGTYTGPADTGIIVNGVKAYTTAGTFYVPVVGLGVGSNTLEATATTLTGATATTSNTITQSGSPPAVELKSSMATNFAPATMAFTPVVGPGITVSQIKMDYNGDGTDDFTTTNPNAVLSSSYNTPGLYVVRLTIVDNTTTPSPTTYLAYAPVFIQDIVEVRETLCSVFGYLRTSLAAANVAQAVQVFAPEQQSNYQTFYNTISNANLPVAASRMGVIANGLINNDFSQLKVVKPFQGVMASFGVDFSRDENGVWRIDAL